MDLALTNRSIRRMDLDEEARDMESSLLISTLLQESVAMAFRALSALMYFVLGSASWHKRAGMA